MAMVMKSDFASVVEREILEKGWALLDLPDPSLVDDAVGALRGELRRLTGDTSIDLETYHEHVGDDPRHIDLHLAMTAFWQAGRYAQSIMAENLSLFADFLGPDIWIHKNPFLRMVRPGKVQDNNGYHRDTVYGGTAYEVSVFIPLIDLPAETAPRVLTGSHVLAESAFPFSMSTDASVPRGSPRHAAGFNYAKKVFDPWFEKELDAVAMKAGQVMVIGLSLMHGQYLNEGAISRWTSDFCAVSAVAPIDPKRRDREYEPLSRSVMMQIAARYDEANQ
jgi:hypothetical protein